MEDLPNTHINGTRCIDYIYLSRNLLNSVASISILPFSEGFPSDHRGIVLQVQKAVLLDHNRADLTRPQTRLFKTTEVKRCQVYQAHLLHLIQTHRMTERLDEVVDDMTETATPSQIEKLNELDQELGQYIRAASKKANKGTASLDWSPAISNARLKYRYWKVRVQMKIYNMEMSSQWIKLSREVNLGDQLIHDNMTLAETHDELKAATSHLKSTKKNHIPLRIIHLQELADHYAGYDNERSAKILKRILKAEELNRHYKKITTLFKGVKSPLTSLLIPNSTDTGYQLTSDQQTMFDILTTVNLEKLRASESSPFISGELNGLDTDGFTPMSEHILLGTLDTSELTTVQETFIQELSKVLPIMTNPLSASTR